MRLILELSRIFKHLRPDLQSFIILWTLAKVSVRQIIENMESIKKIVKAL